MSVTSALVTWWPHLQSVIKQVHSSNLQIAFFYNERFIAEVFSIFSLVKNSSLDKFPGELTLITSSFESWKTARLPFLHKRVFFKFWVVLLKSSTFFDTSLQLASEKEWLKIFSNFSFCTCCITPFSFICLEPLLWLSKNCAWVNMHCEELAKSIIDWMVLKKIHRNV